MENIQKQFMLW